MFWHSENFRTRLVVSIGIILIIGLGVISPNAIVLRIAYTFAALVAFYEITITSAISSQANGNITLEDAISWALLPILFLLMLTFSTVGIWVFQLKTLLLLLFVSYGSDVIGYLVGNLIGGKLIKSRPFPRTSPKKTWEGTIASALIPIPIIILVNCLWPSNNLTNAIVDWALVLGPFVSILGDYTASKFKRVYSIKDSCDYVVHDRFMRYIEALLGGNKGHGGYLDRTDSLSFAATYAVFVCAIASEFNH